MKLKLLIFAAALWPAAAWAEVPAGYYEDCEGKCKAALKNQLYTIVKNHTRITYGNGLDQTWGVFYDTDLHENGYWWDMYTTNEVPAGDSAPDNNTMNKEHTFPKSWWGGDMNDAYCDVMHLVPVNSVANSTRSNWPYGEVQTPKPISNKCPNPRFKHGTPKDGQGGGSPTVFEPDDEFKGDLARIYFYMVTCYQNLTWQGNGLYTAEQGTYPTLQPWAIEMLLRWHRHDPVSQKEIERNEGVYKHQNNRNPYVDHPEMVEHIWGDKLDTPWGNGGGTTDPDPSESATLTSPINGDWYSFPETTPGQPVTMEIPVIGSGFTHNLTARIGGDAAALYAFQVGTSRLDAVSISAGNVAAADGYTLTVVYFPDKATPEGADDCATLIISSPDMATPVTANLQGHCAEPVELTAITVLPVENLTDNGYTLRWLPSPIEPDYYTVTRKIYDENGTLADSMTYEVSGTQTSLEITDRDPLKGEALSVTATIGDTESPAGNEVTVSAEAGISGIADDTATDVRYFDASGMELPGCPELPGVYLVRIGSHTAKTVLIK